MICWILLQSALAIDYDVGFTAISYGDRQYWGYESHNGTQLEVPVLSFTLDSPNIGGDLVKDGEFWVERIGFYWLGDDDTILTMWIWEDTDGDQSFSQADTRLDAVMPISPAHLTENYEWLPDPLLTGLVIEEVDRTFHLTVVLDFAALNNQAVAYCSPLWAAVVCPWNITLSTASVLYKPNVFSFDCSSEPGLNSMSGDTTVAER
ncbi:MAG: hypothetical protein HN348_31715, partial [Proteobacteria bacterium]|nr:hypothetical protein [Pseudomonadota bacterium]